MKANIQAVAMKVTTLNSQHALGEAMLVISQMCLKHYAW